MTLPRLDRLFLMTGLWFLPLLATQAATEIKLISPAGYLSETPFLVRVEAHNATGDRDWDLWDSEAILSVDQPGIALSTNRVTLRNGLGTALIQVSGATAFELTATVEGLQASRGVENLAADPAAIYTGTLLELVTTWSGVVRVTGDVTVPAGHTLRIEPGTLVLVEGAASGSGGVRIVVKGSIQSLGTEARPVTITCAQADLNWGQIRHEDAAPSQYQHTFLSKAGRAPGEGHTGTGPAVRASNSALSFDACVISDLTANGRTIGKILSANNSSVVLHNSVLARARMGPELARTGLDCTDTYFMEMNGPDDADGIYLHGASGRPLRLSGCVFAFGDDDAVDTLDARVSLENCIIRDWANPNEDAKGVSVFHGEVDLWRCLIVNCWVGVSAKSSGPLTLVRMDHCTIAGLDQGVSAAYKANAAAGNITLHLSHSIVRAPDALHSDFGPERFGSVKYCYLPVPWPGPGNSTADPMFVSASTGDYHLQPGSPCIDAGDPGFPRDPDGSRTDVGFYRAPAAKFDGVVFNEIMYHPASGNPLEEYIELFNRSVVPVNLNDWRISAGVGFTFSNVTLAPGGYVVVAADLPAFRAKYPGVTNVVGNWSGQLSNSREQVKLSDAQGQLVNSVRYASEGDWAERRSGLLDRGHRGLAWFAEHDGQGPSLELIHPNLPNDHGQNWASSRAPEGTPGAPNSVRTNHLAPLIDKVAHYPIVPSSGETVTVSARVRSPSDAPLAVTLFYRVDGPAPPVFEPVPMNDQGREGDASPGDGIYTATLPPQPNLSVVEFYVRASDLLLRGRTWPAPVLAAADGAGTSGQVANALYLVDDSETSGTQPLYRIILTEAERAELQDIGRNVAGAAQSDAQMNATFISRDGTGQEVRYLAGVRNRGHGTRTSQPNNFRVNFRADDPWKGVLALNLNSQFTWLQILGAALHLKSGLPGASSSAVQLRINSANPALQGNLDRTYGSYAANEVVNADWAGRHFPVDSGGNAYRALRDLAPSDFDYRTLAAYPSLFGPESRNSYTNTWFKTTNRSEDDWTDLIAMLRVMGMNGTEPFTPANVRRVINVENWIRHLAVMNLLGNAETGLNSGYNDDYFMYRGVNDPRFVLVYYDLDQILGLNRGIAPNAPLFSAANTGASQRAGQALGRFLRHPEFEPLYYAALDELLQAAFSAPQFNALVDQVLGEFVPEAVRDQVKAWMEARRSFVQSQLPPILPSPAPIAKVTGVPRSPTPLRSATLEISGPNVTHYRYSLNGGALGAEWPVDTPIALTGLPEGTNRITVLGLSASGAAQSPDQATLVEWVVRSTWPGVRLNEILASRTGGPDQVELYNESVSTVNLSGMRLTDDLRQPNKFTFGSIMLAPGAYLVLDAGSLGFSLNASGEALGLFASAADGGALLDSVAFGHQIANLSIGRIDGGEWHLTQPTLGAFNVRQPLGQLHAIRINEWLALGVSPYPEDFVELHNPLGLPVAIGGCWLSDEPFGAPTRSRIAPLSFVPPNGCTLFTAGSGSLPGALSFGLAAEQGQIALFAPDLSLIDSVIYGPQQPGQSMGRCPDGAFSQQILASPTPGAPNHCVEIPTRPEPVTLVAFTNVWKFEASGADLGVAWIEPQYDDSAWSAGPGLLGFEESALPEPMLTTWTNAGVITVYFRTGFQSGPVSGVTGLQLTHLVDDGAAFYLNGREIGARYNLPPVADYLTRASAVVGKANYQVLNLPPEALLPGMNLFAAEVHQSSRSSSDLVFGLKLEALVNTNSATEAGVLINELLVDNRSWTEPDGSRPAWIELYNASNHPVDLAGMSLTDGLTKPSRYVFPSSSILAPRGFLKLRCDPDSPASSANTGFGLSAHGGAVYLFHRVENGGTVQSSITYGLQAADYAIGRAPDGSTHWVLTLPTPAAANAAAPLGDPQHLRLNEWMASPAAGPDWFELFNPAPRPVDLSGLWLSDSLSNRMKHALPPLSFLGHGAHAFQLILADEELGAGADHAGFKLSAAGEALSISRPDGVLIDGVTFASQQSGVSEGRLPDGNAFVVSFPASPSPGSSNFLPAPLDLDSDGDGMPDSWELVHGFDPHDASDAADDPDSDGYSNLQEYWAGTDPRRPSEALRITATLASGFDLLLEFPAQAGRAYRVEACDALSEPVWEEFLRVAEAPFERMAQITVVPAGAKRFFRVVASP